MNSVRNFRLLCATLILSSLVLGACNKAAGAARQSAPPPAKVTVAHPIVHDYTQWDEYTGHLEAVERVEVKAQVSGFVDSVNFTEGSIVKAGDLLLTIDTRIFKAQLDAAEAQLLQAQAKVAQANATLHLGQDDLKRALDVQKLGGITAEEVETRKATVEQDQADVAAAQAEIAAAQAAIKTAQLNIEWCSVKAPITGKISSRLITPGNLLSGGSGQTTTITTIDSVDPIYCYVDADEASILKYEKLAKDQKTLLGSDHPLECYMGLTSEEGFPHTGKIDFVDNQVNPLTGTLRVRAIFPNPEGALIPGFFARLRIAGEQIHNASMVIDDCIGSDQDRRFVYVLHPDNTIEQRTVTTGGLVGPLRVILTGLKPEDLVLVNGIASVRPGAKVDPTTAPMPESSFASAAQDGGGSPADPSLAEPPPSTQPGASSARPQTLPAATEEH